ncbi:MAG: AAA family ATPase [Minisyncoccota bacterium]
MNQYFLLGYPLRGLRSLSILTWNSLRFVAHYFSFIRLLGALFAPWKRDITSHMWRGFRPLLFLKMLFNNLIARFFGTLIRVAVLSVGMGVWWLVLMTGLSLMLLYLGAPFLLLIGILTVLTSTSAWGMVFLFCGMVGFGMFLLSLFMLAEEDVLTLDIVELRRKKYFHRILVRLGLPTGLWKEDFLYDTASLLTFLQTRNIDRTVYERAVKLEYTIAKQHALRRRFWVWENLYKKMPMGKGWQYAYTPHLDRYCLDLSRHDPTEYRDAEFIGRREEFQVITVILKRPVQNSVMLVGEPGVGKKTLTHYLARLIRENNFSRRDLGDVRLLRFDLYRAVDDAVHRGEDVEHFLRTLFTEATYAGNIILIIDDLMQYLGLDRARPNLTSLFAEFLAYPNFCVIALAPTGQYHMIASEDEKVLKFFEAVYLRETDPAETFDVLIQHFASLERGQVIFTIRGLDALIQAASRYNWDVPFPERAIDLAQEVVLFWQSSGESYIDPETVNQFVALKTGMPSGALQANEREKLLHLEETLHQRVIGQEEAVTQVAEVMRKARAGFGNTNRPIGSFLFLGPSGVGKTETAKAFAEHYFGSEEKMIRLDMSEFQTSESIDRLLGSRVLNIQGRLITLAREHPFSILLLDEIEKAYPRALDLFLQILDEGYITDGFGSKVSFRDMIIIATSNAGAPLIQTLLQQKVPVPEIRQQVLDQIVTQNIFRLEFLNRFNGLIFFEPLRPSDLQAVTQLKLRQFADRLKKEKNIIITFADDVVEMIIHKGFDARFGARSINRFIENAIEDVIVQKIISGVLKEGETLMVSGEEL